MKKNLFFAALAVALTMGFTSCSDDDDTPKAGTIGNGDFSDTYYLCYNLYGASDAESENIINTCNQAVNAVQDGDTIGLPKVTVYGKDSADCVNTFAQHLSVATQKLSAMNFDDDCDLNIMAFNSNDYEVYSQHIGATENDRFTKQQVNLFYMNEKYNNDDYVVTSLYIRNEGKVHWWNTDVLKNGDPTSMDVNGGISLNSYCIYICARVSNEPDAVPVSDVIIVRNDNTPEDTLFFNNATYRLVKREAGEKGFYDNNLNANNNGGNIYLYYTTDPCFRRTLKAKDLAICYRYETFWQINVGHTASTLENFHFKDVQPDETEVELVQTYLYDSSWHSKYPHVGPILFPLAYVNEAARANNGNLNYGHGGKKSIYLRCVYAKRHNTDDSPRRGTATYVESGVEGSCDWVRLWDFGPRWAVKGVKQDSLGLSPIYDVKEAICGNLWGSNWQLPAKRDFEQLVANCDRVEGEKCVVYKGRGAYAGDSLILYPVSRYDEDSKQYTYSGIRYQTQSAAYKSGMYMFFYQFGMDCNWQGNNFGSPQYITSQPVDQNTYVRCVLK